MTDFDDLTKEEKRIEVCRRLGVHENCGTPLTKPAIHSLLAYLTGEFETRPSLIYDAERSPSRASMMEDVAVAVEEEVEGEPMAAWFDWLDHASSWRQWRTGELGAILEAMESRGDRRVWVQGEVPALGESSRD